MKIFSDRSRFLVASIVVLIGLSCLVAPRAGYAQKGQTSLGTDFWLGFMPNSFFLGCCPPEGVVFYIGSGTANAVNVDVYGGTQLPNEHHHQIMAANSVWTLAAISEANWESQDCERAEYRAIHIYSKNPIVVYGYQYTGANTSSTDSYLGMPTPALGTEYYPSCWYDDHYTLGSGGLAPNQPLAGQFLIISPYDNNVVTIGPVKTPTRGDPLATTILHQRGETWDVTLMKGQTYLVQSTGLAYGDDDITGTHIVSTQPIALISGHQLCSIPIGELAEINGSKDEVFEMIPPLSEWGSEYYDMPTATRSICGDLVRVIAGENGETLIATSVSGVRQAVLNQAGDFYDFDQVTDPTVFSSQNGKKFLAVQHAYSQAYLGDPGLSDPFSIVLTPKQQFQKKMIFRTPDRAGVAGFVHYGTFICQTDSILKIQLNGKPIGGYIYAGQLPIPGTNPPMSAYRIQFPGAGIIYVATCGAPFGCYLYGWSTFESYGHPAGMALGTISPDTLPPLEKHDSLCGNFQVQLMELRHIPKFSFEDTRISDIGMITDSSDARWPRKSFNYTFTIDPAHPFHPGDSTAFFNLTLIDGGKDAYAAIWTTDKAGNDTVYQYYYTAPKLSSIPISPFDFGSVRVSLDSCRQIVLRNDQPNTDLVISSAIIEGVDTMGKFMLSPSSISRTLHPGDTIQLQICFTPSDTVLSFDTLIVMVNCAPFRYALQGLGVTPLIIADNLDFGNITVGDTKCLPLTLHNVGKWPLVVNQNWVLQNTTDFSFANPGLLPDTIPAGGSFTLQFCFHPQATGPAYSRQDWGTDLLAPFLHQIKDTSSLLGYGIQAGLNWDRPKQGFWTECSLPVVQRVNLINPATGVGGEAITVDSVSIIGQDSDEFSIVANQTGFKPPWNLASNKTIWVDLQFTPNLTKLYRPRIAQIVAYGASGNKTFNPSIALSATVRHSTIRITPPTYNFGTVQPQSALTTTAWIHNDGDTALSLTNLAIDAGFTITGFTPGELIQPGDSVQVRMDGVAQLGSTLAKMVASGPVICTDTGTMTLTAFSTSLAVEGNGHVYGDLYVCKDSSAVVTAQNTGPNGSKDAILLSVRIVDTLGSTGASQFTFTDGTQSKFVNQTLHPGDGQNFTVKFTPKTGGGTGATIVYTWIDASKTPADTFATIYPLTGNPLHYVDTLSLQKLYGSGVYSVNPGQVVSVPIQMKTTLDAKGGVYGISFTLRYRRDEFVAQTVIGSGGLVPVQGPTVPDPSDNNYELLNVTLNSTTPITQLDTIAYFPLEYVVNKDTTSSLELHNLAFLDKSGAAVCWVTPDTIPGVFSGLDLCGNSSLRIVLNGGTPDIIVKRIAPNPVVGQATIEYGVAQSGLQITMEVYNLLGEKTLTIMTGHAHTAGAHTANFDTSVLPEGTYFLRTSSSNGVISYPFVVQR